ncbi:hypothetical protein ISN76_19150 [Dyella halodurans]|uniref:Uncharacterized protein n=1 Tax=Dyella halodurans TaxID=1920171 RepID=A0ABV9C011_9GAMM|nr:hypothetical protein [Dyella halodurans]
MIPAFFIDDAPRVSRVSGQMAIGEEFISHLARMPLLRHLNLGLAVPRVSVLQWRALPSLFLKIAKNKAATKAVNTYVLT